MFICYVGKIIYHMFTLNTISNVLTVTNHCSIVLETGFDSFSVFPPSGFVENSVRFQLLDTMCVLNSLSFWKFSYVLHRFVNHIWCFSRPPPENKIARVIQINPGNKQNNELKFAEIMFFEFLFSHDQSKS